MNAYTELACVYDELQSDVPYGAWVALYEDVWARFGRRPRLLLDAGCGTGTVSCLLAEAGVEVIGCDASEDMLAVANEKAEGIPVRPMFIRQRMEELDLYGTVDGVVSSLDCMNYLPDAETLTAALSRIALFMEPGSLLIFDVNTAEKLRALHGRTVVKESENAYCVWQNTFLEKENRCRFDVDLFISEGDTWRRTSETQFETAFSDETIRACLKKAGLRLAETLGPTSKMPETARERVFYVAIR